MRKYTIKKGNHKSKLFHGVWTNNTIYEAWQIEFLFDKNCIYGAKNMDSFDLNKLFRVGIGWNHHKNSYGIAWGGLNEFGEIDLYFYSYQNGKRSFEFIGIVYTEEHHTIFMEHNKYSGSVFIQFGGINKYFNFFAPKKSWGFIYGPYFGGNNTAPHDMTIYLDYKFI